MAVHTIYRGLGAVAEKNENGLLTKEEQLQQTRQDIGRYVAAVQQGLITARGLTPELQGQVAKRLENFGGKEIDTQDAHSYLAREFVHGARTKEDFDRNISGMSDESITALLDGAKIDYIDKVTGERHEMDEDKRRSLADKALYHEAFTKLNADGTEKFDMNAADQYAATNEDKIVDAYKNKKISNASLSNDKLRARYDQLVDDDDVKTLTKDSRKRFFFNAVKADRVEKLKKDGATFSPKTLEGRENLKDLRQLVIAARGGSIETRKKDVDGKRVKIESLVAAYGTDDLINTGFTANVEIKKEVEKARDLYIRTNGDKLSYMVYESLKDNSEAQPIVQSIVNNITVKDLTSLHDTNTQSVIAILGDMRKQFEDIETKQGLKTEDDKKEHAKTDEQYKRLWNIFDPQRGRLKNNDVLNGY
jgi:hypothetical protein